MHLTSSSFITLRSGGEGKSGRVYKIADLGLTKLFFEDDVSVNDSPTFIAPEVLRSDAPASTAHLDPDSSKIDLWSLGVTLLTALAGEVPFNGEDMSRFGGDKELDVPSQLPRGLSRDLVGLLRHLLRFEPSDRIDFAGLLAHPVLREPIWFVEPFVHTMPCAEQVTALAFDARIVVAGLEFGLIKIFARDTFR